MISELVVLTSYISNNNINLRELFYDRNPGDARVKVGSERKVASSPTGPTRALDEIGVLV